MLKFPSVKLTQKRANITFNEIQLIALIEKGLNDNSLRGFLYKRSSPTAKWRLKWFLLFENLLFYFDLGSNYHPEAISNQQQQQLTSPSKSSTFGSLIRRQTKQPAGSPDEARLSRDSNPFEPTRRASVSASPLEWRPLSLRGTPTKRRQAGPNQLKPVAPVRPLSATASGLRDESGSQSRQRLSSDPQNSLALEEAESLNLSHQQARDFEAQHIKQQQQQQKAPHAAIRCQAALKTTTDSSSISGVSNHFLAHNEQTIGRSTTTTAGKTASGSFANYSSLLSRKIGVIFLEGSYCEPLADSKSSFSGQPIMGVRPASQVRNCPPDLDLFEVPNGPKSCSSNAMEAEESEVSSAASAGELSFSRSYLINELQRGMCCLVWSRCVLCLCLCVIRSCQL